MFGVPPNIFNGVGCARRPDVRIILHRSDQPNRSRVVPNVIPSFVQVRLGSNQAVKRFIGPDRPRAFHHLVYLVSRKRFNAMENFCKRMHPFFACFLNGQRLNQQMNMVGHDACGVTLYFFAMPVMAGFQCFRACFRRKNELVVSVPGYMVGSTRNFKMWEDCVFARWVPKLGSNRVCQTERGGRDVHLDPRDGVLQQSSIALMIFPTLLPVPGSMPTAAMAICARAHMDRVRKFAERFRPNRDLRVCGRWQRWFRPVRPIPTTATHAVLR